ncbi:MAG: SDR family NAD(P)-dependent oxidoreductase [Candidatus Nanopelagicales bacterium]
MTDLRTRSIIVVGATGGLGAPIAALLAEAGAQLTLVARDESRLAAVDVPGQRVAIDVRLASSPDRIVDAATSAYGGLDGIVYAAARASSVG